MRRRPIVIADDEEEVVKPLLAKLVKDHDVVYAATPFDAYEAVRDNNADLIVLDHDFRNVNAEGCSIMRPLKDANPGLIIFVLTSHKEVFRNPQYGLADRILIKGMLSADLGQVVLDIEAAFCSKDRGPTWPPGRFDIRAFTDASSDDRLIQEAELYLNAWIDECRRVERLQLRIEELKAQQKRSHLQATEEQIKSIEAERTCSRSALIKKIVNALCRVNGRGSVFTTQVRKDIEKAFSSGPDLVCTAFDVASQVSSNTRHGEKMQRHEDVREIDVEKDWRLFYSLFDNRYIFTHFWPKEPGKEQHDAIDRAQKVFDQWCKQTPFQLSGSATGPMC